MLSLTYSFYFLRSANWWSPLVCPNVPFPHVAIFWGSGEVRQINLCLSVSVSLTYPLLLFFAARKVLRQRWQIAARFKQSNTYWFSRRAWGKTGRCIRAPHPFHASTASVFPKAQRLEVPSMYICEDIKIKNSNIRSTRIWSDSTSCIHVRRNARYFKIETRATFVQRRFRTCHLWLRSTTLRFAAQKNDLQFSESRTTTNRGCF